MKQSEYSTAHGSADWHRMMKNTTEKPPEASPRPLNAEDTQGLLRGVNAVGSSVSSADMTFSGHSISQISTALKQLAAENKIHCLNRARGKYCSLKTFENWDEQRRFQESMGGC